MGSRHQPRRSNGRFTVATLGLAPCPDCGRIMIPPAIPAGETDPLKIAKAQKTLICGTCNNSHERPSS